MLSESRETASLAEALEGVRYAWALSGYNHEFGPKIYPLRTAAASSAALLSETAGDSAPGDIAFVFGTERDGLSNKEVMLCHAIAAIPADSEMPSLNLAQAVQVCAYEVREALRETEGKASDLLPWELRFKAGEPASASDVAGFISHLEKALIHVGMTEDFLAGRPWKFTELVPHALEDDWDVDESVDEINEERAEVWGALDQLAAAQGEGSAVHGVSRKAMTSSDGATADAMPGETRRLYSIGVGGNPSYDAPRMRYSFSSYTRPGELHDIDPATGEDRLLRRATVLGGFEPREYMERRVWVTARDGERIPVSLVWRRDVPACDSAMFVTGYGAYEISSDPGFSVSRISMLDRGVLYAVPHIRGGGEMGRAWYEQGHLLNKKHSFEDFVDAVRALQRAGLASPARTVADGGSAGGLLMGAVANMAPECFAGVEADVPFVDALTSILDPSLPLTVTEWDEWGDPLHNADVYRYMKEYTPYENAPSDANDARVAVFPKIFITTSMNDTRVLYVEPMKWLARLQRAGVDAVAKIEVEAGHGGTSGRYKQWEEISYENAWCLGVMGITS